MIETNDQKTVFEFELQKLKKFETLQFIIYNVDTFYVDTLFSLKSPNIITINQLYIAFCDFTCLFCKILDLVYSASAKGPIE